MVLPPSPAGNGICFLLKMTDDDSSRGAISGLSGLFLPLCPALYSILSFLLLLFLEQLHLCAVKVGEKKSNFTQLVSFVYQ